MNGKTRLLPAAAAVCGVAGLLVRRLYLARCFDPDTGLPVSGQPYGAILWAVALAALAAAILPVRGKHRSFDGKYSSAFYAARPFWFVLNAAGGALIALSGLLGLMAWAGSRTADPYGMAAGPTGASGIIRPVLGVVCLLAGAGICLTALKLRQKGEYSGVFVSLPGFAACLWVMASYQDWAKDPVLGHYLFRLLAVLLAMAACYCAATFAYGKARVSLTLALCLAAAALGIMVLGDGQPLYDVSLQLGLVLYLLAMAGCLLVNDGKPETPAAGCAPADCRTCPGCAPAPQGKPGSDSDPA